MIIEKVKVSSVYIAYIHNIIDVNNVSPCISHFFVLHKASLEKIHVNKLGSNDGYIIFNIIIAIILISNSIFLISYPIHGLKK